MSCGGGGAVEKQDFDGVPFSSLRNSGSRAAKAVMSKTLILQLFSVTHFKKTSLFQNKILFVGGGWWGGVLSCGFAVSTTHCTESRLCSTDDASRCKPLQAVLCCSLPEGHGEKAKVAARTFAFCV